MNAEGFLGEDLRVLGPSVSALKPALNTEPGATSVAA